MKLTPKIKRVARLAAQLGREDAGSYRTLDEVARDACAIVTAAEDASSAVKRKLSPAKAYRKAERVARVYHARVVTRQIGQPAAGFCFIRPGSTRVLGLRFNSGQYSDPKTGHVYYVI